MHTYIIGFAMFLCTGIAMRFIHPDFPGFTPPYLVAAGFLLVGALLSLLYRARVLAFLFFTAAVCIFFISLPLDNSFNYYLMGIFALLLLFSFVLIFLKMNGLVPALISALFLGYGLTCIFKDLSDPNHLSHWATDAFEKSLVYATIVKEPEIRPETNRTTLTLEPHVLIHLRGPEAQARVDQILAILKDLKREWENEGEALSTLYAARDKIRAHPQANPDEIVTKAFSAGDYRPEEKEVRNIRLALDEIAQIEGSRINQGWILATIFENNDLYYDLSHPSAYGDVVKVVGSVRAPMPATNPGGFDYRRYLTNTNYYAQMSVSTKASPNRPEPDLIEILEKQRGNPFIAMCISVKYKLLDVIRQTTPFPDSCFMSGILLGLRRGVTEKIMQDSRAAGTAHVFAVSGLHVTIIALIIYLIFNQTPIPKTIWAPITVLLLFIFTTITGSRPSALRAAIMNSFGLIFFTYFGKNIQRSAIMGIAFAAIVILAILPSGYGGPLVLPEASFLMSFSAVLFLCWVSGPAEHFLNTRLNNLFRLSVATFVVVLTGLFFVNMENLLNIPRTPVFWIFLLLIPACFLLQRMLPFRIGFTSIPSKPLRTFLAAQVAIQLSMIPLSTLIFHRMSLAAPFANLIAIPLIGIVLPLGFLASLIGLIPFIGIQIAILLTAGNWIGLRFFIILDDFFARVLPYPQVPKPGAGALIVFYLLVVAFVYREKISLRLRIAYYQVKNALGEATVRLRVIVSALALAVALITLTTGLVLSRKPLLKVTFLDLSYPARGESVLVEAPNGDTILVDGGFEGRWGSYSPRMVNQGERGLQEVLLDKNVISLDAVVNTNYDACLLGGLNFILGSPDYYIRKLYSYLPPDEFGPGDIDFNRFEQALTPKGREHSRRLYRQILLNIWTDGAAVDEFMRIYWKIDKEELTAFLNGLPEKEKSSAEVALAGMEKQESEAKETLLESIISTYEKLGTPVDRAQAEELAAKWKLPLMPIENYRQFITDFSGPGQWFVYQKAGLVRSLEELAAYLQELYEKFQKASRETKSIYREQEKFVQAHRFIFFAKEKGIPVYQASAGLDIIKPVKIRGKTLQATILSPPPERFTGNYVIDSNSTVIRIQYGNTSVLLTSLINQKASEWLIKYRGGIKSAIYQVPEYGMGGRYINPSAMLEAVSPEVAIFHYKGGKKVDERFQAVWGLAQARNIRCLNTPVTGAVTVISDGDGYRIETMLEEKAVEGEEERPTASQEVQAAF